MKNYDYWKKSQITKSQIFVTDCTKKGLAFMINMNWGGPGVSMS